MRRAGRPAFVSQPAKRAWVELAATVLLALAAVATAWSSYQAARWNGEQSKSSAATNKTRIEAARAAGLANAQAEIDVATFTQWVDAYARGERELTDFYFKRFRTEFKPAMDAWIATRPLRNPNAPLTPFAMPQYRLAARAEAARLDARAEVLSAQVRRNIQRSTNYVLGVVLFAVALFFAAMCTKLTSPRLRTATFALGALVFLVALAWIATSPVSLSV
jgi:TRAP-type C4-dicarboxylate transport system permease small subunit